MYTTRTFATALVLVLVGPFGCAGASADAQDELTVESEQALESAWGALPTNPGGMTATMQSFTTVHVGPCRFTGVVFEVDAIHRAAGILARQGTAPGTCKPAGGVPGVVNAPGRFLHLATYNGPQAFAWVIGPGPNGTLAFVTNGSSGPFGSAIGTMPMLRIKLIRPLDGEVLRDTTQSVCASGPGGSILVNSMNFGTNGNLRIGGTKNAPTGLTGDGECPSVAGAPFLQSYHLTYPGFGFGTGPVPQPTIE